jgi:hypothetical protein
MHVLSRSGQYILLNGQYYFTSHSLSRHWPEEYITDDLCNLIWTYIENNAQQLLLVTTDYEEDHAAAYMIEYAVSDLHERDIITY